MRVDRRIRFLEKRLDAAVVVAGTPSDLDQVRFGARVTVVDEEGVTRSYVIVGPDESNPETGYLSFQSPVGRALMKKRVGDVVVVKRPIGDLEPRSRRSRERLRASPGGLGERAFLQHAANQRRGIHSMACGLECAHAGGEAEREASVQIGGVETAFRENQVEAERAKIPRLLECSGGIVPGPLDVPARGALGQTAGVVEGTGLIRWSLRGLPMSTPSGLTTRWIENSPTIVRLSLDDQAAATAGWPRSRGHSLGASSVRSVR